MKNTNFVVGRLSKIFLLSFIFWVFSAQSVCAFSSISESDLVGKVNAVRVKNSLSPLKVDVELTDAAREKAQNMLEKGYWAHFSPDGLTPWYFIKKNKYMYKFAGENLAKGFNTSDEVFSAWMNSPKHRDNILSKNFKDIGFSIQEGVLLGEKTILVVEMLASK